MNFDIYEIEKLEIRLSVLSEIKSNLVELMVNKIYHGTKAYFELDKFVNNITKEEKDFRNKLINCLKDNDEAISNLKIKTEILNKLINLRKELKVDFSNDAVEFLIDYYNEKKICKNLVEIYSWEMPSSLYENIKNSKFYIAITSEYDQKIVYTVEDIIVNDNIEYLNLINYKTYTKRNSESFMFPSSFTLSDLDDFFDLLFR